MTSINYLRKQVGATLGLIIGCTLVLVLVGIAFIYLAQTISGDKQVINATDAGALAAAHQIMAVTLTTNQVNKLPQVFRGLGVDPNGNTCPSGQDSNGNPALFNILAYNNCAAYTLEIAFNAAADGSPAAISNANDIIAALKLFGQQLNTIEQTTPSIPAAANKLMAGNSDCNLPSQLFGTGSQNPINLVPESLKMAYYFNSNDPISNVYLNNNFIASNAKFAGWAAKVLSHTRSKDGPLLLAGAKSFNPNTITGRNDFVGNITLAPLGASSTHLIATDANNNYYTSVPGVTDGSVPYNALALSGESGTANANGGNNNNGATIGANSQTLNLIASSAAVTGSPIQYAAYFPSSDSNPNQGGAAYVAIINGGDFQTSLNSAGDSAAALQAQGYSNVDLTSSTNIAFNGAKTTIFDVLEYQNLVKDLRLEQDWIIVGTDSITGMYDIYATYGIGQLSGAAQTHQTFPATNYNNVIDNPNLSSRTPSIPFVLLADYLPNNADLSGEWTKAFVQTKKQTISQCLDDFGPWIRYNRSHGSDALGHDSNLDPLKLSGGSPAKLQTNPNFMVVNTLISATSKFMQGMTISDATKLMDICVLHDGPFVFNGNEPDWMDNLIPVIASNYGFNYLPDPIGKTKASGFTAIEYAKAQVVCLHGGAGLSENPPVLPSRIGNIFLPGSLTYSSSNSNIWVSSAVRSGLRYFQPYDSNGNAVHYAWPEPNGCPPFEMAATPLQLLKNMNILHSQGYQTKFNSNDTQYNNLLGSILTVLQQINSSITMDDLTAALDSATMDLGQTFYLIYDKNQQKLVMVQNLPTGMTYQPADGGAPSATYASTYVASSSHADEFTPSTFTLINTSASPNITINYKGNKVAPAPYGDSEMNKEPYNEIGTVGSTYWGSAVTITDTAELWPSSGANSNHGELHLYETAGNGFTTAAIN